VGGGAAEVPVVDLERSGQAEQRLDRQEYDLPPRRNRASMYQFPELLPRLVSRQVQVVGKISHMARLLFASSTKHIFGPLTTAKLSPRTYLVFSR
jgi:hypothetical protein